MNELAIRPLETDEEGWTEIVLVVSAGEQEPEGQTIGHLRVVEGTEDGPHTWWDALIVEKDGRRLQRRFVDYNLAVLAMALRCVSPDTNTLAW